MRVREQNRVLGPYEEQGVWRIIIVEDGRKRTRKLSSFKEAIAMKKKVEEEFYGCPSITIENALGEYREYLLQVKQNQQETMEVTMIRLKGFFQNGDLPLQELTEELGIRLYRALLLKYAVATHRRMLVEAKTFLNWCIQNRWLTKNPFQNIQGQGRGSKGKKQLHFDEAKRWMKVALDLAHRGDTKAIVALSTLLLGLRSKELVSLSVRDVDQGGRLLWVPGTKSRAAKRHIEVPMVLQPFLLKLCKRRNPEERLFLNSPGGQYEGKPHHRTFPRKQVIKICKLAGVPLVSAHGMRGLHSTLAIQAGTSPHMVAQSLGHESIKTTLSHYASPDSMQKHQQQKLLNMLEQNHSVRKGRRVLAQGASAA